MDAIQKKIDDLKEMVGSLTELRDNWDLLLQLSAMEMWIIETRELVIEEIENSHQNKVVDIRTPTSKQKGRR